MKKTPQACPTCHTPLIFRRWSSRYEKTSPWQEALATCPAGCGKFGIRYFNGVPTSQPYQVRAKAKKTKRGSYKIEPNRAAAISALYGSIQKFIDTAPLVGMSLQSKQ